MAPLATIYRAFRFREPVTINTERGETTPSIADMLRYDLAFHAPEDPSFVIFPIFQHARTGRSSNWITEGRWRSFSTVLHVQGKECEEKFDKLGGIHSWITYRHPDQDYARLVPQTLEQFLAAEKGVRIIGWR